MAGEYETAFLPELFRGGGTGMAEALVQGPLMAEQYRQAQLANELAQWKIETEKARPQHMQALDALMALRAKQQGESLGSERAKILRQLMAGELTFTPEVAVYLGVNPYQVVTPGATALNKTTGEPSYTAPWAPKVVGPGAALAMPGTTPDAAPTMVEGPEKTFAPRPLKEQLDEADIAGTLTPGQQAFRKRQQQDKIAVAAAMAGAQTKARNAETPPTAGERETLGELENMSQLVTDIETYFDPGAVGPIAGMETYASLKTGIGLTPEKAKLAVALASIENQFIKVRSGTAVSGSEATRMANELPRFWDPPELLPVKVAQTKRNIETLRQSMMNKTPLEQRVAMPAPSSPKPSTLAGQPKKPGLFDPEIEKAKQAWKAQGLKDYDDAVLFGKRLKTPQARKAWDLLLQQYVSGEFVP